MTIEELIDDLQKIKEKEGYNIQVYNVETYKKINCVGTVFLENNDNEKVVIIG